MSLFFSENTKDKRTNNTTNFSEKENKEGVCERKKVRGGRECCTTKINSTFQIYNNTPTIRPQLPPKAVLKRLTYIVLYTALDLCPI